MKLAELIIRIIKSDSKWRVVSTTATLTRAIPFDLEAVLPPIGSAVTARDAAWLTLDFWIDDKPKPRVGVFWRSNPVRDRARRNIVLKALLETGGTNFEYKGKSGAWSEINKPAFSGITVSDAWWPAGQQPDLQAAQSEVRAQLQRWNGYMPRIIRTAAVASKAGLIRDVRESNEF